MRLSEGEPVSRQELVEDVTAEVSALEHEQTILRALRRFKLRETLRIAYGDIIREHSLKTVTSQISHLADAILEAAVVAAWKKIESLVPDDPLKDNYTSSISTPSQPE